MNHGTITGYTNNGCRCDECRAAKREYEVTRRQGGVTIVDSDLRDLLTELFPFGLTDDCPARQHPPSRIERAARA